MPGQDEYARARQAVLDARDKIPGQFRQENFEEEIPPEVVALRQAEDRLRQAERDVAEELDRAWQRNQRAVAESKKSVIDLLRRQAKIEVQCGTAARMRDPRHAVLNAGEVAAIREARDAVVAAREEHVRTIRQFKEGVTPEQLVDDGVA